MFSAIRAIARGLGLGLAFLLVLAVLSSLLMTRGRAEDVAREALRSEAVMRPFLHVNEDYFTDCTLLIMLTMRADNFVRNVIESWLPPQSLDFGHPCVSLQRYVDGKVHYTTPSPYVNYWFGSRHLEAVVFRVLTFSQAQTFYRLLSYAAVLILALASWRTDRATAAILMPVFFSLLLGFGLHLHGHNLAHAPGFFIGFSLLALLVAHRRYFETFERRLSFFACLAVVVSFFDLLNGPLLIVLSLSLVLNHFFYSRNRQWRDSLRHSLAIVGCFAFCYVLVTIVHLGLLDLLHDGVWQLYVDLLAVRLGSDVSATQAVGARDLALALWQHRSNMTIGGMGPSTWFLFGGLVAWLFAAASLPLALRRDRDVRLLTDLAVVAAAGLGVLAWYLLFPNHTFVHASFTVRYLALPTAYGGVAALLAIFGLAAARPDRRSVS